MNMSTLSHLDSQGRVKMVDVSDKRITCREAVASGEIHLNAVVIDQINALKIAKGNVLETARLAGIMAAKKTDQLIPLCHSLNLDGISIDFHMEKDRIVILSTVKSTGKTGVEMEALAAVTVSALTIYDMCKAVDKSMTLGPFTLLKKSGGRSGVYERNGSASS